MAMVLERPIVSCDPRMLPKHSYIKPSVLFKIKGG